MDKFTVVKVCVLVALASGIISAAFMRSHLNAAHKIEVAKLDRACLKSVFTATQIAKKHKKRSPNAIIVAPAN